MDATNSLGQPRIFISRTAILHNVAVLRRHIKLETKICAVIKADAYGHGAALVADALCNFTSAQTEAPAVDALAVATIDEAAALGQMPVPIMVLRPVENIYLGRQRERLEAAVRAGWTLTVCSAEAASDLARLAVSMQKRANIQIMIDTGMCREGAPLAEIDSIFRAIDAQPSLKLTAVCTHFSNAEDAKDLSTQAQLIQFETITQMRAWKNPGLIRHAANSGGIFFWPNSHFDMVRPGLSLYGLDPTCAPNIDRPLRPALKWTARIHMIRNVRKGECVGYAQSWKAQDDTRVGLIPVGYADGYLRAFSNRAVMMVHNKPAPVIGRVSMDFTTIDLTNVPEAQGGDPVTILDSDPLSPASVYNLASIAQTLPYEIVCRIGNRIPRIAIEPADEEASWDSSTPPVEKKWA